jgi:biotin transporter BioY
MEIKDLESLWSDMDRELEKQKKLTNTLIMEMTQQKYSNKFQKISVYETIGGIICFVAGIYFLAQFSKLDTWYLQLCGALTVLALFLLPILTLRSLYRIQGMNISDRTVSETIIRYTRAKDQLLFLQRLGMYLSVVLMLTILPVASKISSGKDMFVETSTWYLYIPIMAVFLFFFARFGYGCYKRITSSAENLLRELE